MIQRTEGTIYLFEGLLPSLKTDPLVTRKLKDVHRALRNRYSTLFIVAPSLVVPEELQRDMTIYQLPMPDANEMENILTGVIAGTANAAKITESLTPELKERIVKAALGLSLDQAARAFRASLIGRTTADPSMIDAVIEGKGQLIRKSGILNFVTDIPTLDEIGGLENLKSWLRKRNLVLSDKGKAFGLQIPKGS